MVVAEVCSSMKYPKRCQYKHAKQKKYHVRNWAEYNEGLRRRGDLTVWFDEEAIANWKADKTGKPGGQRVYSDMAIETGLVVRMVYKLAYRQTEGFLHSIASLLGLGIEIPDYSTLCRRSRLLRKKLRIPKAASTQPIHLMIDSTGLRIHVGNARKPPKQRAWRKLHIAVDRETGNIVASELTASRARDATRVPALLTQIQAPLVSVAADSAYDKEAVYEAIEAHSPGRRTRVVIPPQRNATLSQNSNTAMQERDRHIRAIERHGPPSVPSRTADDIHDRALGAFLGLAVGDAVGTTLEFCSRDTQPRLEDMVGGGPFDLPAGAWTDDTAMALALVDSLAESKTLDCRDLMDRFVKWWRDGDYSWSGDCFDIGNTTCQALTRLCSAKSRSRVDCAV